MPPKPSDADYAKKHKLKELFEFLMEQCLLRRPNNPETLIMNTLIRRHKMTEKAIETKVCQRI